uniref:Uncharacterized protein n=1 Tax=Buteo japonicus TaxID=224669 RepID=A0A8B9Z3U8_9AVES
MRSSMDWPFSRRFSILMSSFTPSTTICTSSTSEKPRRSALETSNTPPTAAVSTPPGARNLVSTLTTARAGEYLSSLTSLRWEHSKTVLYKLALLPPPT